MYTLWTDLTFLEDFKMIPNAVECKLIQAMEHRSRQSSLIKLFRDNAWPRHIKYQKKLCWTTTNKYLFSDTYFEGQHA